MADSVQEATAGTAEAADPTIGAVLVVGAGVAGIRAALDLAEVGYRVLLTDSSPAIGGILSKLDYQFPTDHCGMCKMLPLVGREVASQYCMRKSLFHDNIKLLPFTEVTRVAGQPGAFHVELTRRARHVDTDVCMGTGRCEEVCPVEVPSEFNEGLTRRKAIYRPVPHNIPNMYLIDMDACTRCGECVKVCPVDAIKLDSQDESLAVDVDAIILAAGASLQEGAAAGDLTSYGLFTNVVTALEYERLLSACGRYDGAIRRPSDGQPARRIAWLQCVGSRNRAEGRDYCSSVCCMFALKEAVLAHEKGGPGIETTIFYMDMRTFGKDHWRYRDRAEREHGVKLVRCRVRHVQQLADGGLRLRYLDAHGEWQLADFDLVVLSTGQSPQRTVGWMADLLGVPADHVGFFAPTGPVRVGTPKEGVFACGGLGGLTDISDALVSGSAAAGAASRLLARLGKKLKPEPDLPPERPVARERSKVHVILCRWNHGKMPEGIELEPLRRSLLGQPGVGAVDIVDTLCRGPGYEEAGAILKASTCNRVLFGACLPYVYRQRLKLLAQAAGFNPGLVEVADLRGTIQRRLLEEPAAAVMRKVYRQIQVPLEKLRRSDALAVSRMPQSQAVLVVGGGLAGMQAALALAERGVAVHLVERGAQLGGCAADTAEPTLDGIDPAKLAAELRQAVWESKRITVYRQAEVLETSGSLGRFRTRVRNGDAEDHLITHGAVILATGARPATTAEYGHGACDRVLTQTEVGRAFADGTLDPAALGTVVFIQCVGSRERGGREYCSRVCCAGALAQALALKRRNPKVRVVVLYRDLMAYGMLERAYTEARGAGVVFAAYEPDAKPQVETAAGRPRVTFTDPVLREPVTLFADLVCLGTGIAPNPGNATIGALFGVELTEDGFLQEAEPKWRPLDTLRAGVFLAGTAHSPRRVSEALLQAEAAAQRVFNLLARRELTTARAVAQVHDSLCARCRVCVDVCPYHARTFDPADQRILVDPAACQGCGMCAVACPSGAAEVLGMGERQHLGVIEATLRDIRPGVAPA
jgi:heterodisulfide reductase subunit A